MTRCCDGCVLCEVDGQPIPAWLMAEVRDRERQAKAALDAYESLAAPTTPPVPVAVGEQEPGITPRERGRIRRERLDAIERAAVNPVGERDRLRTGDRRQTHGGGSGKGRGPRRRTELGGTTATRLEETRNWRAERAAERKAAAA